MSPHRLLDTGPGKAVGTILVVLLIGLGVLFAIVLHGWVADANDANYADHLRSCQAQNEQRAGGNLRASIVAGLFSGEIVLPPTRGRPERRIPVKPPEMPKDQRDEIVAVVEATKSEPTNCAKVVRRP